MTGRRRTLAEFDVAFRAGERRALVLLIDLVVENSTVVQRGGNVTTLGAATRLHRHLLRHITGGIHRRDVVTLCAFHVRVCLMSKSAGGSSIAPRSRGPPIRHTDRAGEFLIEIGCHFFRSCLFVTAIAVCRQRRELGLLVMTREACRVCDWSRLESPFLQPEGVTDVFGRLRNELIVRFALWLVRLMAVCAIRIRVLVVREEDAEL